MMNYMNSAGKHGNMTILGTFLLIDFEEIERKYTIRKKNRNFLAECITELFLYIYY